MTSGQKLMVAGLAMFTIGIVAIFLGLIIRLGNVDQPERTKLAELGWWMMVLSVPFLVLGTIGWCIGGAKHRKDKTHKR